MKTKISILLIAILMAAPKALAQEEVPSYACRTTCFRNLNRTLGSTRPFLSFTPLLEHRVNDTTPYQNPF